TNSSWGHSGAASEEMLPSGKSGWIEFTVPRTNKSFMIGLSTTNTNALHTSIKYALYISSNAKVEIRENGVNTNLLGSSPTYAANDKFKVEIDRSTGKMRYYQNENLLLERPVVTSPLLIDVALGAVDTEISNIRSSFGLHSAKEITRRFEFDNIG